MDSWFRSVGRNIAQAGKITHDSLAGFGQNAGNALDSWGKEMGKDLDPSHPIHIAMTKTGEFSFAVARQTLSRLDGFGQQTERSVTGAYNQAHKHFSEVDWDSVSQEAREWVQRTAKELGVAVAAAEKGIFNIPLSSLPGEIAQWIAEHPKQTAFIIVGGTVFFAPYLVTVPVLNSLGFSANGVAAGSAAAAIQSMIGPVRLGSIFSLLQSAGAGGSGLAVVNVLTSTSAGIGVHAVAATCAAEKCSEPSNSV